MQHLQAALEGLLVPQLLQAAAPQLRVLQPLQAAAPQLLLAPQAASNRKAERALAAPLPHMCFWPNRNALVNSASMRSQFSSCCNTPCAATAADDLGEPSRAPSVCLCAEPYGAPLKLVVDGPIANIKPRQHARRGTPGGGG